MNYSKHYNQLISRAKSRGKLPSYQECHHIIPRCMGGKDVKENLIYLTASEHFVAHQLLVKMHPNNSKLLWAAHMMTVDRYGHRIHNKEYQWIKEKLSKHRKLLNNDLTFLNKIKEINEQRKLDPEIQKICSQRSKELWKNPDYIKAMKLYQSGEKFKSTKSKLMIQLNNNKTFRESQKKSVEKLWNDPSFRTSHLQRLKERWNNNEYKQIHSKRLSTRNHNKLTKEQLQAYENIEQLYNDLYIKQGIPLYKISLSLGLGKDSFSRWCRLKGLVKNIDILSRRI